MAHTSVGSFLEMLKLRVSGLWCRDLFLVRNLLLIIVLFSPSFNIVLAGQPGSHLYENSSLSILHPFKIEDTLANINKNNISITGFSLGFYYSNYLHNSKDEPYSEGLLKLHSSLYNFAIKWRSSLFETRFGLGLGKTNETHIRYQTSHFPNSVPLKIEDDLNTSLFQFNLQARLYVSKRFRLTPHFWLAYSVVTYLNTQYPDASVYQAGVGLHYRLYRTVSIEASAAYAHWDEGNSYDISYSALAGNFEIGIYKLFPSIK